MPFITNRTYRQKRPKKELGYKKSKEYASFYNDRRWDTLRTWKKRESPLCEACLLEGIATPTEEIHHARVFRSGKDNDEKWQLFLDPNNLIALCHRHHKLIHKYMNQCNTEYATLEQLVLYDNLTNDNL